MSDDTISGLEVTAVNEVDQLSPVERINKEIDRLASEQVIISTRKMSGLLYCMRWMASFGKTKLQRSGQSGAIGLSDAQAQLFSYSYKCERECGQLFLMLQESEYTWFTLLEPSVAWVEEDYSGFVLQFDEFKILGQVQPGFKISIPIVGLEATLKGKPLQYCWLVRVTQNEDNSAHLHEYFEKAIPVVSRKQEQVKVAREQTRREFL